MRVTPLVQITSSDSEICEGEEVIYSAIPDGNSGGDSPTYQWFINDVLVNASGSNYNSTSMIDGDVVSVNMTSNAMCASPLDATSAAGPISVFPIPETPVVDSSNNILTSSTGDSYQWYINGQLIEGATDNTYTPTVSGDYSVVTTSSDGCESAESNIITIIIDSVIDTDKINCSIYPNPFHDELKIQSNIPSRFDEITITDATGRILLKQNNLSSRQVINTTDWASGIYIVRVIIASELREFKIAKQ